MSWTLRSNGDSRNKYVRFVGVERDGWRDWHPLSLTGITTLIKIEKNARRLAPIEREVVNATFKWMNEHIPCPPFLERKGVHEWGQDDVCWWHINAHDPIRKMRPLIQILRSHGFVVRSLYTDRLSNILYQDRFQVVARWQGRHSK